MLNHIWIALIALGILAAAGNDIRDEVRNTYRNGAVLQTTMAVERTPSVLRQTWEGVLEIPAESFNQLYGDNAASATIRQSVSITTNVDGHSSLTMPMSDASPKIWRTMAQGAGTKDKLTGIVREVRFSPDGGHAVVSFTLEPVRLVKMRAITAAAFEYAGTAVTIAIGLIGIMAFWLGVMKVAEEAGLLKSMTRILAPVTRRLFPDVPVDHPAIGAIVMNIAANMLGLSNAATPMGLKAMEELNKLNPKLGTATNAMVTFLAINTGGLVLIPATAIAVRAAAGSANPGIIIGTSVVGAGCATLAGILAARILQRVRWYRTEPEARHE